MSNTKETLSRRYMFNKKDMPELQQFGKRIVRIVTIIIAIKLFRLLLIRNEGANDVMSQLLTLPNPEQLFRFASINLMMIGIMGLLFGYIVQGKAIIQTKWFPLLFFFCILDAAFIYVFPEIPLAISQAILNVK